ncbi:putative Lipoprotein [Seiridium cardinale]|uniref:Lipoprotein n=1 Tax=Seiridium cardinale TaxID=138064 RepID=A0ABR2XY47_9PEZI
MKTATVLLALISTVWAGCYGSGDIFQDKANARYHAQRACEGYDGNAGAFQGFFSAGQAKSVCVQGTTTQKYDMSVQNLNTGAGFDLADGDCTLRLHNEINGCDRGGQSDVSGWRFRQVHVLALVKFSLFIC